MWFGFRGQIGILLPIIGNHMKNRLEHEHEMPTGIMYGSMLCEPLLEFHLLEIDLLGMRSHVITSSEAMPFDAKPAANLQIPYTQLQK